MTVVLVTKMFGVGKSAALVELARRLPAIRSRGGRRYACVVAASATLALVVPPLSA